MLGGKCVRCGSTESLEFDHIDRTIKSFTIGGAKRASRKQILAEAAKCQLLCHDHHLDKSYEMGDLTRAQHRTYATYSHGCRCPGCTEAHRDNMRAYRAKKRTSIPE